MSADIGGRDDATVVAMNWNGDRPETFLGFEIYDVMKDPGVPESLLADDSAAVRMQTMQRQIVALRERLQAVKQAAPVR